MRLAWGNAGQRPTGAPERPSKFDGAVLQEELWPKFLPRTAPIAPLRLARIISTSGVKIPPRKEIKSKQIESVELFGRLEKFTLIWISRLSWDCPLRQFAASPLFYGFSGGPRHRLVHLDVGLPDAETCSLAHLFHSRHILVRYRRLFDEINFLLFHAHSLR